MKYLLVLPFLFFQSIFAQTKLPVINATSNKVAINDGGYLDKNAWTLSPKIKPDVFTADRTRKTKWVTFYTDIDSIKVKVKPGTTYNFVVLLNGKDSCYTQITSAIPIENNITNAMIRNDTIPFKLTSFNAIHVKAVINNTDTINLHFDLSSFDFHFTKEAILKKTGLLSHQPDAVAGKVNPDFNHLDKVYKLQMGKFAWSNPSVIPTTITAKEMDGRFGWNLFEGKVVQIDYDHNWLIIHSRMPKAIKGYVKSKLEFTHSYPTLQGIFQIAGQKYAGQFLLDTGSEQAIIMDNEWAAERNILKDLTLIRTSVMHDPRGKTYETKIVFAPVLIIGSKKLTQIPTYVLGGKNPSGYKINYLGNGLLKRFNMILDFKNDNVYLKPNQLIDLKYKG